MYFYEATVQIFYCAVMLAITGSTISINYSLKQTKQKNAVSRTMIATGWFSITVDIAVKNRREHCYVLIPSGGNDQRSAYHAVYAVPIISSRSEREGNPQTK